MVLRSLVGLSLLLLAGVGCAEPRRLVSYPPDTLLVPYEPATTYSSCLVAGVAMAANYLEGARRFTVPAMLADLQAAQADESRVDEVQRYLRTRGLHLLAISGELSDRPEQGLAFWVRNKGYPAICIINRSGDNPAFNHAVVVIGVQPNVDSTEIVQYLDPSADQPLYVCTRAAFETVWERCGRALLLVVRPPPDQNGSDQRG